MKIVLQFQLSNSLIVSTGTVNFFLAMRASATFVLDTETTEESVRVMLEVLFDLKFVHLLILPCFQAVCT
jgi:hypothetical protein